MILFLFLSFNHSFNEQFYLSYILPVIHCCQFQVYYRYKLLKNNTYERCYYCESVIAKRTQTNLLKCLNDGTIESTYRFIFRTLQWQFLCAHNREGDNKMSVENEKMQKILSYSQGIREKRAVIRWYRYFSQVLELHTTFLSIFKNKIDNMLKL